MFSSMKSLSLMRPVLTAFLALLGHLAHVHVGWAAQDAGHAPAGPVAEEMPGISAGRPDEGPCVELPDGRFMVPYTMKVPGTEIAFEMVPVPGGTFLMGSPEDEEGHRDDEGPQVEISVEPFWMGKTEVTWAEYKRFMALDRNFKSFRQQGLRAVTDENRIDAVAAPSSLYDSTFTFDAGGAGNQPCATVTQFAAKQYTKYLSLTTGLFFRLPTEAEWEYACRAGTATRFSFGDGEDDLENHAWFEDNSDDKRHAVGKLAPNPWGLHDMHGNVAEWVLDAYDPQAYGQRTTDERRRGDWFLPATAEGPRVVRGGSWELPAEDCRSAARMPSDEKAWKAQDPNIPKSPWWYTDSPATGVGFRLLRPLRPPTDRESREIFWKADAASIQEDVDQRMFEEGKGAFGIADPELPGLIR